ncbi:hypothetical protein BDW22DRAFT_1427789 [Trametopsis cervina]|nr:hypothetical protein BDW22DRAFT_1427789 [Trametopsis cervina]
MAYFPSPPLEYNMWRPSEIFVVEDPDLDTVERFPEFGDEPVFPTPPSSLDPEWLVWFENMSIEDPQPMFVDIDGDKVVSMDDDGDVWMHPVPIDEPTYVNMDVDDTAFRSLWADAAKAQRDAMSSTMEASLLGNILDNAVAPAVVHTPADIPSLSHSFASSLASSFSLATPPPARSDRLILRQQRKTQPKVNVIPASTSTVPGSMSKVPFHLRVWPYDLHTRGVTSHILDRATDNSVSCNKETSKVALDFKELEEWFAVGKASTTPESEDPAVAALAMGLAELEVHPEAPVAAPVMELADFEVYLEDPLSALAMGMVDLEVQLEDPVASLAMVMADLGVLPEAPVASARDVDDFLKSVVDEVHEVQLTGILGSLAL